MNFFKKKFLWAILYGTVLIGFSTFVVLDTFSIERTYIVIDDNSSEDSSSQSSNTSSESSSQNSDTSVESSESSLTDVSSQNESASSATVQNTSTVVSTDTTYSDENIKITVTTYRENNTNIYVADVTVSDSSYLKTVFAKSSYGKNVTQKTSAIAQSSGAILAINGDFYGARNSGYVIRNGVIYRDTVSSSDQQDLVLYSDGSMDIVNEGDISASELLANGAEQVLSFGPGLVQNGQISVTDGEEVGKAMTSNPRTAIGMIDKLHYVFVVSDGRTNESEGLSLYQLAEFMQGLGVTTAYNLDGGGSSTMYFNGNVINNPTTNGNSIQERAVSDIVSIGY